jgi:fatty-acyl-CoA synthase
MHPCEIALEPRHEQGLPHESTRQGLGQRVPFVQRESDVVTCSLDASASCALNKLLDPFEIPPLRFGQIAQRPEESRIEALGQPRDLIEAESIPSEGAILIRCIFAPLELVDGSEVRKIGGVDFEQRTHPLPVLAERHHRGQPLRTGTTKNPEQDCFRLITCVMGSRDPTRTDTLRQLEECAAPQEPRRLFESRPHPTRPIGAKPLRLDPAAGELETCIGCETTYESLVRQRRLTPQLMIHMSHDEIQAERRRRFAQELKQNPRIAPAGDCDQQSTLCHPAPRERILAIRHEHPASIPRESTRYGDDRGPRVWRWRWLSVLSRPAMDEQRSQADLDPDPASTPSPEGPSPLESSAQHNVGHWIARGAREHPAWPAWADDSEGFSYAEADARVERLTGWLLEQGIEPGDRIALWLGNRVATLEVLFASARVGAIALPINARLTPSEVAFQLDDSETRLLFIEPAWSDAASEAVELCGRTRPVCVEIGATHSEMLSKRSGTDHCAAVLPEDPMILMYTSGTTGKPKGALLPHRKALYNSLNAELYFGIRDEDRVLVVAPLFHSLGLQILTLPALHKGAAVRLQEGFDAERVWRTIDTEGITYFGGVPTMHQRLLDALDLGHPLSAPPPSLRFAFTAGAAASKELIRDFHRHGLRLKQGYGQTETSTITCLDPERSLEKAGSVGRPVRHAEIRLIDPDSIEDSTDRWRDADIGSVGEIVVRGPITMLGYWRRPEATAETIREGWLRTGDLATRDADFDITLVGRAREMYISGGENVYPAEIEATLVEHPAVREAAVVAVDDPEWGEVGHAHVVRAEDSRVTEAELESWLAARLAPFKRPRALVFEPSLPRTASGKVQKHRLERGGSAGDE